MSRGFLRFYPYRVTVALRSPFAHIPKSMTAPAKPVHKRPAAILSHDLASVVLDYAVALVGPGAVIHADCFDWLERLPENTLHAVVTDPPYGVKEFQLDEVRKLHNGNRGGIWRIPPSFDGHTRSPLPRFTALTPEEINDLREFFRTWAKAVLRALRPGGHVFIASNAFVAQPTWQSLVEGGLEFRGEVMRLVRTLRGGDRPKGFETEFPDCSSLPRGCYEPWGLFRKPMPKGMTVGECLRKWETGAIRRLPDGRPFADVISSERTPKRERDIAGGHPSVKPQSLMRQMVHAALPLGRGIIADPFAGSGSTVAAAAALGLICVASERHKDYFDIAARAAPLLAGLPVATAPGDPTLTLEL